jgi:hypothetical protein
MAGGAGVFAGVTVRGAIATQSDAALLAGAEMDPGRSDLYAFLALGARGLFDRFDRIDVRATFHCHFLIGEWKLTLVRLRFVKDAVAIGP